MQSAVSSNNSKSAAPFNSNFQDFKVTGTRFEYRFYVTFGPHGVVQLNRHLDAFEGLFVAVDYWLDLLNEFEDCWLNFVNEHRLEWKVVSRKNMLHMVDIMWTSLKHILHIMEILEESLALELKEMLVKSDEIVACGWWDLLEDYPECQKNAVEFCKQHFIDDSGSDDDSGPDDDSDDKSDSDDEAEAEAEAEDEDEDEDGDDDDKYYNDYLSGQNTPIGSDDNMSIESDDDMPVEDDGMAIGGDQYPPDFKTLLDWIIVYVYLKNEWDMKVLLKKMNDQVGKTMQKLIDKCLFDVK